MISRRRGAALVTTILAVAVSAALPAGAQAGSLLSGYGGPGQGSQAVLGSTLINGPGGGSGGGAGSGSASGAVSQSSSSESSNSEAQVVPPFSSGKGPSSGSGSPSSHRPARGVRAGAAPVVAHHGAPSAVVRSSGLPSGAYTAAERTASPGQPALGFSADDLLVAILVLLALGAMGVLTSRLTRGSGPPKGGHRRHAGLSG